MALGTAIGFLVALAVPLWLVVEQVMKWRVLKSRQHSQEHVETGRVAPTPDDQSASAGRGGAPGQPLGRKAA
jgi:hypothetical protein